MKASLNSGVTIRLLCCFFRPSTDQQARPAPAACTDRGVAGEESLPRQGREVHFRSELAVSPSLPLGVCARLFQRGWCGAMSESYGSTLTLAGHGLASTGPNLRIMERSSF